jgi:hypothetical protein
MTPHRAPSRRAIHGAVCGAVRRGPGLQQHRAGRELDADKLKEYLARMDPQDFGKLNP